MRVLITGASGFIGTALTGRLRWRGDEVVPLGRGERGRGPTWDPTAGRIDDGALDGMDAVVHLAGESILPPWTAAKRRRILESRRAGTSLIAGAVAARATPVLVSASGIDFYGDRGDDPLTETELPGSGFLAGVAQVSEAATAPAAAAGSRVVIVRNSLVLDGGGGSLPKMMIPFRLLVGGHIGAGTQFWSWITLEDEVRAIIHCLDHDRISGPVNMSSPNPVRNEVFMRALGEAMHRPAWFPAPASLVRLVLGADAARSLLLESKRVLPGVLRDTGFVFSHPEIGPALAYAVRPGHRGPE